MTSKARGLHLAFLVLFAAPTVLLAAAAAAEHLPGAFRTVVDFLTTCPYRAVTRTPCPLCGGTTALIALVRGDLDAARAIHPGAVFAAPGIAIQTGYRFYRTLRPLLSWKEELVTACVCAALGAGLLVC